MIVLPFVGGVVVDRINRIHLLYVTQTGQMLIAFSLAALTWLGWINVWYILAASFIGGVLLAFDNPARQALVPDMVASRDLFNAMSLNAATYNGAALLGPAIAGALLGPLGAGSLFFINGVSFLAVLIALLAMRNVRTHSGGRRPPCSNPPGEAWGMPGATGLSCPCFSCRPLRPSLGVRTRTCCPFLPVTSGTPDPQATGSCFRRQAAERWWAPSGWPPSGRSGGTAP